MAKSPVFVSLDLSTTTNSGDKAVVDKRLLTSFFKKFEPSNLEELKTSLKTLIDNSQTLEEMAEVVDEHLYITQIATKYHGITQSEALAVV